MSKILFNNTGVGVLIADTGITVPASGSYVIPQQDDLLWAASSNVITKISDLAVSPTVSTLKVNDGSVDLNISDGTDLIKGLFPTKIKILGNSGAKSADVETVLGRNRLFVDGLFSPFGASSEGFLNISFGSTISSPAWPAVKPLGYYVVPTSKTFKLLGVAYKTASSTTYLSIYRRRTLWRHSSVALVTPAAPTLTARTILGAGLTLLATYRYKIVAVNHMGTTVGGAETSITLSSTQNAVNTAWTAVSGATHYEVFRTSAGGAANTQVLLGRSEAVQFIDVTPDSELDVGVALPGSNTTLGSVDGSAYSTNFAATTVVIDTIAPITTATPLDIIYRNVYGDRKYISATPGTTLGSQVELQIAGRSNPSATRIPRSTGGKHHIDVSISDILSIGNTPATGSFIVFGHEYLFQAASEQPNKWSTTFFETPISFPTGDEIVFGVSSNAAVTTLARNDIILIGTLE